MLRLTAFCVICVLFMSAASAQESVVPKITNAEEFEEKVLKSHEVTLVLMTMKNEDETKMKGVNREECQRAEGLLEHIVRDLHPHGIQLAMTIRVLSDLDDLAPIASEFNVRKRMLPTALLFHTRARTADVIKLEGAAEVQQRVLQLLEENNNPKKDDGKFTKVTLALGGADL